MIMARLLYGNYCGLYTAHCCVNCHRCTTMMTAKVYHIRTTRRALHCLYLSRKIGALRRCFSANVPPIGRFLPYEASPIGEAVNGKKPLTEEDNSNNSQSFVKKTVFLVLAFLSSSGTSCPTLLTRGAPLLSLATFPPFCGEIAPTGEGLIHMRLITSFFNSKSRSIGRLLKILY